MTSRIYGYCILSRFVDDSAGSPTYGPAQLVSRDTVVTSTSIERERFVMHGHLPAITNNILRRRSNFVIRDRTRLMISRASCSSRCQLQQLQACMATCRSVTDVVHPVVVYTLGRYLPRTDSVSPFVDVGSLRHKVLFLAGLATPSPLPSPPPVNRTAAGCGRARDKSASRLPIIHLSRLSSPSPSASPVLLTYRIVAAGSLPSGAALSTARLVVHGRPASVARDRTCMMAGRPSRTGRR